MALARLLYLISITACVCVEYCALRGEYNFVIVIFLFYLYMLLYAAIRTFAWTSNWSNTIIIILSLLLFFTMCIFLVIWHDVLLDVGFWLFLFFLKSYMLLLIITIAPLFIPKQKLLRKSYDYKITGMFLLLSILPFLVYIFFNCWLMSMLSFILLIFFFFIVWWLLVHMMHIWYMRRLPFSKENFKKVFNSFNEETYKNISSLIKRVILIIIALINLLCEMMRIISLLCIVLLSTLPILMFIIQYTNIYFTEMHIIIFIFIVLLIVFIIYNYYK